VYTSENEQVEALQRWWEKNGRSTLIAIAVAIALVLGWRGWQEHRATRAAEASVLYQQVIEQQDPAKVLESGRALLADYGDTAYASLASLAMASAALEQDDADAAAAHLRAAMEGAAIPGIKQTAAVRLARVLLSQEKPQEALAVLDSTEPGGLRGAFEEARGDVQLALGNKAAAREAYQNALAEYGDVAAKQNLLRLKLDDLAGAA
jgi:predicted negative regulator of RcsB-dependent stress response